MADRVEEDRVAAKTIAKIGLVIFVVLAASLLLLGWLAHFYRMNHPGAPGNYPVPAPPQITPTPRTELEQYLAEQQNRLETYGWSDRERGWARIPIERAMALYAAEAAKGEKQ